MAVQIKKVSARCIELDAVDRCGLFVVDIFLVATRFAQDDRELP